MAANAWAQPQAASAPAGQTADQPKSGKSSKTVKAKAPVKNTKAEPAKHAVKGKAGKQADHVSEAAEADSKVATRSDIRTNTKPDPIKTADAAPPPGTMMGAYGQSLMRTGPVAPPATMPLTAQSGSVNGANGAPLLASVATSVAPNAPAPTISNSLPASLPPTAMMGAAGVSTSDAVARLLQQRGAVAQADTATPTAAVNPGASVAMAAAAAAANPSLLNQVRDKASDLVLSAMNFLGVPYRLGGNSVSNGFDCSGFTRHIFEMSVGLVLPRRADEQAKLSSLIPIKKDDLKPGDLVFFNTMRATFSHVGIYVGEGKFIHSPRAGGAVRVEDMREAYWAKRFTGARRADLTQAPNT